MAVFIAGATTCPICNLVVQSGDDVLNFPPLFLNHRHEVFEVTDAVVHRACLMQRPYSAQALEKLETYERRRDERKHCKICRKPIDSPDDYFGTGPLSDDPDEPIARFDWFEAHVHCLREWEGTAGLTAALSAASASPDWEGDALQGLVTRLKEIGTSDEGAVAPRAGPRRC
jgi:hypothetical protein